MWRVFRFLIIAVAVVFGLSLGFQWYFSVPQHADRMDSTALAARSETRLGAEILPLVAQNPGTSGVLSLRQGQNAFAARMLLADAAQDSIDVRYYIWHKDATGLMLLDALRRAADRGVRVRLLLDDNGTPDLDPELAELDAHPNVEIRLFNPFVLRSVRLLSLALDFSRLNRRMHNKSFSVDGIASIVGGRNVGDDYFAHGTGVNFYDLDVVVLGDAAAEVGADFDLYWASPSAVPVDLILKPPVPSRTALATSLARVLDSPSGKSFAASVQASKLLEQLYNGAPAFSWSRIQIVSDDPAKGQGPVAPDALMIHRLILLLGAPFETVDLVSAYFIPGDKLTSILAGWAGQGIRVRVLTNAQESTDVLPVHSGYRKYRPALLEAGVQLFELKPDGAPTGPGAILDQFGLVGSTKSSLHAKAFVIDGARVFVGSFNFDPRSAILNTEMGVLIDSAKVADVLYAGFTRQLGERAYRVVRGATGATEWLDTTAEGVERRFTTEPGTTVLSRAVVRVIGWLPVIWLL